jgi:hypothetical protein
MKQILFLSDLHVGGYRSLWPEGGEIETDGGNDKTVWPLTRAQEYLWECWNHLLTTLPRKLDAIVVNGDAIQGHRDPWATKLCASSFNDQEDAAVKLLEPLRKRTDKFFMTAGTKYHQPDFADSERKVAKDLKAQYSPWLNIHAGKELINVAHGHATGFVYRATMLEREFNFNVLAAKTHQTPLATILARAHIHFYALYSCTEGCAFFQPCWQLPDESVATRLASFYKQHPMLGAVLVKIENGHQPEIIPVTYDLPEWDSKVVEI